MLVVGSSLVVDLEGARQNPAPTETCSAYPARTVAGQETCRSHKTTRSRCTSRERVHHTERAGVPLE